MREEFIELLVRLVMDGFITEEEAGELLDEFDRNGELPPGWQLPLSLQQAILSLDASLLTPGREILGVDDEISMGLLQTYFMRDVTTLGQEFGNGSITLQKWQADLRDRVVAYLAVSARMGRGGDIPADEQNPILESMGIQMAYLSRFADTVATGRVSEAQVISRSKLYAGEGRALFYMESEIASAGLYGYVVDYISLDDRVTCQPCRLAEGGGPYLPGQGPLPGRTCLGRGYCRCRRVLRYDPPTYLRLLGISA